MQLQYKPLQHWAPNVTEVISILSQLSGFEPGKSSALPIELKGPGNLLFMIFIWYMGKATEKASKRSIGFLITAQKGIATLKIL